MGTAGVAAAGVVGAKVTGRSWTGRLVIGRSGAARGVPVASDRDDLVGLDAAADNLATTGGFSISAFGGGLSELTIAGGGLITTTGSPPGATLITGWFMTGSETGFACSTLRCKNPV